MRRQHRRRRARERLELPERVGVEHDRQLEPLEQDRARARSCRRCGRGPGPIATASACSAASSTASAARGSSRPAESSGSGRFTASSSARLEHRQRRLRRGDARRSRRRRGTRRAPRASARRSARASRRRRAREPARYFVDVGRLARHLEQRRRRHERVLVLARSRARSARPAREPAWKRPGAIASPTFAAPNVTVTVARTAAPGTSPVEASTPDGTSTATTGRPARVDPLDHARGVLARRLVQADAEQRVDDHVRRRRGRRRPRRRSRRGPPRAARARRPGRRRRCCRLPQTTVTRPGNWRSTTSRDRGAGALHQLLQRALVRLLGAPRLVGGRASGSSLIASASTHDRDRRGQLARVRHRELDRARRRPSPRSARRAAAEVHAGLRAAAISISFQVK